MNQQNQKLRSFDFETNESLDGNTFYLPREDDEWVQLLRNVLDFFVLRLDELRKRSHLQASGASSYFDPFLQPYMVETCTLVYRIKLLEFLLQNHYIEKEKCERLFHQEQIEFFDELQYQEAWQQIRVLLSVVEVYEDEDKNRKIFLIGKAVLRSLLAGEEFPYSGNGTAYRNYIKSSDYLMG